MSVTPSPDQQAALDAILEWYERDVGQRFTFGGFAGTGKSTIVSVLRQRLGADVAICAPTGKAAHVLRTKGLGDATTVHGLIYKPHEECNACGLVVYDRGEDDDPGIGCRYPCLRPSTTLKFQRVPAIAASLIIVDEASMISRDLMDDLESFGRRCLYVGDHGQIEPVGEDAGLMHEPMVRLETIHRQAQGDPIVAFAHALRTGSSARAALRIAGSTDGTTPIRTDGGGLAVVNRVPSDLTKYEAVLCGYNKTRIGLNYSMRRQLGFSGAYPQAKERVICLKNNKEIGIFNGMQATVVEYKHREDKMSDLLTIETDDGMRVPSIPVERRQFGARETLRDVPRRMNLFDFGYALTVHKSQGSEWQRVLVIEEIARAWSPERWAYTAATRASKGLVWVV